MVTIALLLSLPHPHAVALPEDPRAVEYLEEGLRLYKAENFSGAVDAFRRGFEIEDDPTFLFAWAQAERMRDECAAAVDLYNRFIATDPPDVQVDAAKEGKALCADALAKLAVPVSTTVEPADDDLDGPPSDDDDELSGDDPDETAAPRSSTGSELTDELRPQDSDAQRPWHRDPAGATLFAVGLAGIGAGVGLLVSAAYSEPNGEDRTDFLAHRDQVQTFQIAGGVTAGVGGVLMLAGIVRWVVLAKRQKAALNSMFGASLDPRGRAAAFSVRF